MEQAIYQVLEQIINVTEMTNKWMRWCEQSLPNQSVFVPSVFQMRDAYSHIIALFAYGIEEQQKLASTTENFVLDEVKLFESSIAAAQFSEVSEHTLRAYFDTADYIIECLSEICKGIDLNSEKDSYPLLRNALNKYNAEVSSLRSKKSLPPNEAYLIVERWDSLLQIITSAYSFSDHEYAIRSLHRAVLNTVLDIEKNYDADIIKEFDPDFFKEKTILVNLRIFPSEYQKFMNDENEFMEQILEDPVEWQNSIKNEFSLIEENLKAQLDKYQILMETMFSTALIRKVKGGQNYVKNSAFWVISTLLSVLATTYIGQKLFLANSSVIIQVNHIFLLKICLLFIIIEVSLLVIWHVIRKIGFSLAKKNI